MLIESMSTQPSINYARKHVHVVGELEPETMRVINATHVAGQVGHIH
jgi:hypothetical protein